MKNKIIIDLHGVKHQEVPGIIDSNIHKYLQVSCELSIITGRSKSMQDIVIQSLYRMKFVHEDLTVYPGKINLKW